jgi:hypothetical protein
VATWGDTDVFPLPPENHVLFDKTDDIVALLEKIHSNFSSWSDDNPPDNESALAMVGYTAFRWVTQIDPLWNAYLLGLVLKLAEDIEKARVPRDQEVVFSYRYEPDPATERLFAESAWRDFNLRSVALAKRHPHVVVCDIADFYGRIPHHPLENVLLDLKTGDELPRRINRVLSLFSDARSYGLPVGGPAARLLSEILLNPIDRLLIAEGISFCRFADDYHLFTDSREAGYDALRFLTEKLVQNLGLTLQRAKTRVLTSKDFLSASAFDTPEEDDTAEDEGSKAKDGDTPEERAQRSFLSLSLRYDPYSPTAREDYATLQEQIERFDIVGMLARELSKSRIHAPLTRRLLQALRYLDDEGKNGAARSLIQNVETLTPVLPNVLRALTEVFDQLDVGTQNAITSAVRDMIVKQRYYAVVPVNLAYAVRLLGKGSEAESAGLLVQLFDTSPPFVQRDIMLVMGRWRTSWWLSDQLKTVSRMHPWVQRAFLISSYQLTDEADHWRRRNVRRLTPLDAIVNSWAGERAKTDPAWVVPL